MLYSKKILSTMAAFFCLAQGISAASGSSLSLKRVTLPQVMATLIAFQPSKYDRSQLYTVLNAADKIKGLEGSAGYLKKNIQNMMALYLDGEPGIDLFGLAIQIIFLATIEKLMHFKGEGDAERAEGLSQEIKATRDVLFNLLQPSLNDSSYSPRGTSGDITPRRKAPGTSRLRSAENLNPEVQKKARRAVKTERKTLQTAAKQDGLRHMKELFVSLVA